MILNCSFLFTTNTAPRLLASTDKAQSSEGFLGIVEIWAAKLTGAPASSPISASAPTAASGFEAEEVAVAAANSSSAAAPRSASNLAGDGN
jgi:hypothetical protein